MHSITCILTSFNRPGLIRQSLESLRVQTYRNFEVIVMDDSSIFDVEPLVKEFQIPNCRIVHTDVTPEQRASTNRLGINCNRALAMAQGDLITFLCDDDYYFPTWFEHAVNFFETKKAHHPYAQVGYGRLVYSTSQEMIYPDHPQLWHGRPLDKPACAVDHNQVIHERFPTPYRWPETAHDPGAPDAKYFTEIANHGIQFYPIDAFAVVKRMHTKNLQRTWNTEISQGLAENARE